MNSHQRKKRSRWIVLLLRHGTTRWKQWCLATATLVCLVLVPRNTTLPIRNDKPIKYILYYTSFWNHDDFKFGLGQEPFEKCRGARRCFVTNNRHYFKSMSDFDAIVFHSVDFNPTKEELGHIQQWRMPHQRFVFFNMESPQTYPLRQQTPPGFYNWTATYRHDSDIVRPYGWFELRGHPIMYPPPPQTSSWPVKYSDLEFSKQDLSSLVPLAKRPKQVAWVVSNCKSASERFEYVRELSKYIPVDIFGTCGTTPCDLSYQEGQNQVDNCTRAIQRDYKFYLGFENTLCKDYVTEKLYSRVSHSVVIVMGGANYSLFAPPHSYIHVLDYDSPRHLAEYLLKLDRNDDLYLSYFWWKRYYNVKFGGAMQDQAFCHLCDKLHNEDEAVKSYASLQDWWSHAGHCGEIRIPGIQSATKSLRIDWNHA